MYLPSHFAETRVDVLHQLIRERPFGTLVTLGSSGLNANHIPFEIDPSPAPFGTLRGHVARANPVWRDFSRDVEALALFQGAQAYVTPSWYQSKTESGEVVPTYNYVVVHAYGAMRPVEDQAWLRALVERLTRRFEAARAEPWQVSDAPAPFIEKQLRSIVGIEIPIARLLGKWKLSQNRPAADRDGVAAGLQASSDPEAQAMGQLVKDFTRS